MPAKKEYTAEFRRAPKFSVKVATLYNWVQQYAPGPAPAAAAPGFDRRARRAERAVAQ
jgi:hypothetical protein